MGNYGKVLVVIFVLLLTLDMFGPLTTVAVAAATPSLFVDPTSYSAGSLGETVPIRIVAYSVFNLTGFRFQLKFNTTLLNCLNATLGSFFPASPNSATTITIDNSAGIISIQSNIQGSGTPVGGWGPLLSVNFKAIYATVYPKPLDTCQLGILGDTLYGIGNKPIQHIVENGTYVAPYATPTLGLTLNTNKGNYHFDGDIININGTLTGNGSPVPNELIALEIVNAVSGLVAARTLPTSSSPPSCPLNITTLIPCDSSGTPQNSFQLENFVYFKVTVTNTLSTNMRATVMVDPYDSSNASLGVAYFGTTVPAEGSVTLYPSLPLEYNQADPESLTPATSGNATVYASVWTDFVENGGIPLALESRATFTITGSKQGKSTFAGAPPTGVFQTGASIHFMKGLYSSGQPATYTIKAGAEFMGNNITQSKQIHMTLAGDINVDGEVTLADLVLLAKAYGSTPTSPKWNPNADIDGNGAVGLSDLVLMATNYGKGT